MRRLLYWLGAATLAIIVIAGTGLGLFAHRGITLDASSKAYVDVSGIANAVEHELFRVSDRLDRARMQQLRQVRASGANE